jgi:hypothetical protein
MNKLWTFGCSFTAEWFPVGLKGITSNYDLYMSWRGGTLPDVWPTLLANKLNMKINNMAIGGNSNYGIINQFYDVCDQIKENDIIIFGWTQVSRFIMANFKEEIMNHVLVCETDYSGTYLSKKSLEEIFYNRTHPLWVNEVHKWIFMTNAYANKVGAKIYHWTSDSNIFDKNSKFANDEKYIIIKNEKYPNYDLLGYLSLPCHYKCNDYIAKISDETKNLVMDNHMSEYGHKMQAEYLYDHITGVDCNNKIYSI